MNTTVCYMLCLRRHPLLQAGFDMSALVPLSKEAMLQRPRHDWLMRDSGGQALAQPQTVLTMAMATFAREDLEVIEADLDWTITTAGAFHGIGSWFDVGFAARPVREIGGSEAHDRMHLVMLICILCLARRTQLWLSACQQARRLQPLIGSRYGGRKTIGSTRKVTFNLFFCLTSGLVSLG